MGRVKEAIGKPPNSEIFLFMDLKLLLLDD
jgi:hypothetical protein